MLGGINQVNINPKVGLTFAGACAHSCARTRTSSWSARSATWRRPRSRIKAAQTGHLVLSTLHTNDAPKTLTRLVDMGVKPYAIATSVSLIIAQRLARRLCNSCKAPMKVPAEALKKEGFGDEEIANGLQVFQAVGCSNCTDGYKGRTGIYEVMPISEEIGRTIMMGGSVLEIKEQATREGVWGLRQAGLNKVRMGLTSLDEINRVTVD
jgi:type IV pilus assembly protein PilB